MKYIKFLLSKLKICIMRLISFLMPYIFFLLFILFSFWADGYTWEDFGLDGFSLNPFDYCNLTDVDYTAVLSDEKNGEVEITEYLTFDVHAGSRSNTYKELWRELPEEYVDGLKVTYDVKSVTQILDDGTEIPYTETDKMYWEDYDYTEDSTYYWHHSDGSGNYPDNDESVLIYIPWTYREKMTFKIVYTMRNAALRYNDCSELYLSLYSGNTIKKLNSYKAQILIPDELMPEECYTYTFGTAKARIPYTESTRKNPNYTTFSIDLDKSDLKFNYHNRYIEFCLLAYGDDKNLFVENAPYNTYSYEDVLDECIAENEYYETENSNFMTYKTLLLAGSIFLSLIVISNAKKKYQKIQEKYELYQPEIDYEYFREIPSDLDPFFASELVFMKDPLNENKEKKEEYAAVLLSLMRKNYITISKINEQSSWTPNNTLIKLEPMRTEPVATDILVSQEPRYITINTNSNIEVEPLTTSERLYLELLERYARRRENQSITMTDLQKCIDTDPLHTNSFVKDMERKPILEAGVLQGYFRDASYDKPKIEFENIAASSLTISMLLLIVANGISYFTPMALAYGAYTILGLTYLWKYVYATCKASNLLLFTQYGANEQAKWFGLYNFLNSDTLLNEKDVQDVVLWEKYLIYATAFGISEKVINAIKVNAINVDINSSPILNNHSYIHSSHHHSISRSFGRSIHTSSRGGGGGFGGHGYGGGGRGGGGGGGGH